ncbi:MAG: long-chain fatty acid--CoA ligase [Deltaproteobacteria bacterium]|nr:long-chain fatty acid--CoA ligase [Deltaproteobacteria bacterium]
MTTLPARTGDPSRATLDGRVLDWMRESNWKEDDARFEELALDLFAFQYEHCAPYHRLCQARNLTPTEVARWQDIPTVPSAAFKEFSLRCFDETNTVKRFVTSGTTTQTPGTLYLDNLDIYEASLRASFQRHILPDLQERGGKIRMRILAPSPGEAPHSSLSHMFGEALRSWGDDRSGFDLRDGQLDTDSLFSELDLAIAEDTPLLLCGTSFAFVHLLDAMQAASKKIALPEKSRIMETGGYKGRSRELPREELVSSLGQALGVPEGQILNQYGMTECGSQFYDSSLLHPGEPTCKLSPPWVRVRLLDPETLKEAAPGETGLIVIYDLANTGSVLALQTADLGRTRGQDFEVLGRITDAEARGCSIGADLLLSDRS